MFLPVRKRRKEHTVIHLNRPRVKVLSGEFMIKRLSPGENYSTRNFNHILVFFAHALYSYLNRTKKRDIISLLLLFSC